MEAKKTIHIHDGQCLFWEHPDGAERCLHIQAEEEPRNPREDGPVSEMFCSHWHYDLGDVDGRESCEEYLQRLLGRYLGEDAAGRLLDGFQGTFGELAEKTGEALKGRAVILPLYLYDHSGISISCRKEYPYDDAFDSMSLGFISVGREEALSLFGREREEGWEDLARTFLEDEVSVYDEYLGGDVYGYTLYRREGGSWEEEFSESGFYGTDIVDSLMADSVGNGLPEAVKAGSVETGVARETVSYVFEKEGA